MEAVRTHQKFTKQGVRDLNRRSVNGHHRQVCGPHLLGQATVIGHRICEDGNPMPLYGWRCLNCDHVEGER